MKKESPSLSDKVNNPHKFEVIREAFSAENTKTHMLLYNLNLEDVDKYGVALSMKKIFMFVNIINSCRDEYKEFALNDTMLKPEYIKSCYVFIAVLHNVHKVTGKLIVASSLNSLYYSVIEGYEPELNIGHSIINLTDYDVKQMALNALAFCKSIGRAADESDYLQLIIDLKEKYSLLEQWLLFTNTDYSEIKNLDGLPHKFISVLFS